MKNEQILKLPSLVDFREPPKKKNRAKSLGRGQFSTDWEPEPLTDAEIEERDELGLDQD